MKQKIYNAYVDILKEELLPAMGWYGARAVAYAGALARKALGALPERVELCVSGNIIKRQVRHHVPHTGGRKGLKVAVAVGLCCGDPEAEAEVHFRCHGAAASGAGCLSGAGAGTDYRIHGQLPL